MNTIELFSMRFALASGACLAAGLGVWAIMALCRRCLPALALQRSNWLLAQLLVAGTFLLVLLPQTGRLRMVPAIELDAVMAAAAAAAAAPLQAAAPVAPTPRPWLLYAAHAWLAMYLLGLALTVVRLLQAQRAVTRLAGSGVLLAAGSTHAGFGGAPAPLPVVEVDAAISPMLLGPLRPRLLLPLHLRSFDSVQQQLIIEHELTHWRRADLHWMTASLLLQTLFWFHPLMGWLRARLSWAQELGCDREVLRGRAQAERKAYAAALVAQIKCQQRPPHMALAFGGVCPDTLAARMGLIRTPLPASRGAWTRTLAVLGLMAACVGNLALQPALAWHGDVLPGITADSIDCTEIVDAASGASLLRQGGCDQRVTPASTFNIAVSLMGYDSGLLQDAHTPRLPFKAGYADWNPSWRTATDPASWITNSTVWYAQHVTAQLGAVRLARYLDGFDYGNRDASGDPGKNNGVTRSWIGSSLQISPSEQVGFLRKLVNRQLPVNAHALDMTYQLLKLPVETGGWQVYGKTGTASPLLADGAEDTLHAYGWFVGWATKGNRTIVFARLLLDKTQAGSSAGPRVKAAFLRDLPARLQGL